MLKRPRQIPRTYVHARAQIIETPGPPIFRGNKQTINALYDFIDIVRIQRGNRLTAKQTRALIKVAKVLISYIEEGKLPCISDIDVRDTDSVIRLKRTLAKYIPDSVLERVHNSTILSI